MSANDYYQNSTQQYQPYNPSQSLGPSPYSQNYYASNNQPAPSLAPLYHSNDPLDHRPSPPLPNPPKRSSTYSDEDRAKPQGRLQTNQSEWPSTQDTAYPPSHESQYPNPALLPSPTRKKKKKRKGGCISGKVPWFVYFVTLVQITVFVVEIIKNCE